MAESQVDELSFSRVFVTGGSGFVGGKLLRRLDELGVPARALARSEGSAQAVEEAGADAVRGDLSDIEAMADGMRGCDLVVHAAAKVEQWGSREAFAQVNIQGTENALAAARQAGVSRFVHVGTEAVLAEGQPLENVDEMYPMADNPVSNYAWSKGEAEKRVREANSETLETVVVRPRLIWGAGDRSILPGILEAIEAGTFAWMDGGHYLTSTTHVDNVIEGLLLAAERGRGGEVYFVSDGTPVEFREFVSEMIRTQGVEPPDREVPRWLARFAATMAELTWRILPLSGEPPATHTATDLLGVEVTIDISKARRELAYRPPTSRKEGLEELRST